MGTRTDQIHETFLVLRSQSGDRAAFNDLLTLVQAPLFRYISGLVRDKALAEDILQEVFLLIYRKIGWLRDPLLFRPWAYRIASRETFTRLKKEKWWNEQVREDESLENVPASAVDDPVSTEEVRALLSAASPASRAVLILHYLEDMKLAETAEILGIPPGTAKSRLTYGLQKIRRAIEEAKL